MASPNLQIPDVLTNANNKETLINQGVALLDEAMNDSVAVSTTGGGTITLLIAETRENAVVELTGNPGAGYFIDMPDANKRVLSIANRSDSTATIRNSVSAGADQPVVVAGEAVTFFYDGTDFFLLATTGGAATFVELDDTPADFTGAAGKNVVVNSTATALEYRTALLPEFRGAQINLTTALTTTNTSPTVPWDAAVEDTTIGGHKFWLGPNLTFTADNTTEQLTATAHGMITGDGPFQLSNSGGALPTGLAAATDYWAIFISTSIIQVASSRLNAEAGTPVAFSDDGTGTHTIEREENFVIPPGVTRIRLTASCEFAASTEGIGQEIRAVFLRDGATWLGDPSQSIPIGVTATSDKINLTSGNITVTEDETYQLQINNTNNGNLQTSNLTWFALEVVEMVDAVEQAFVGVRTLMGGTGPTFVNATVLPVHWVTAEFDISPDAIPFWCGPNKTFTTVNTGTNEATVTSHGKVTGQGPIVLTTSGTLPTGLSLATEYWLINVSANVLKFASSLQNALDDVPVDITVAGSGTHTLNCDDRFGIPPGVNKVSVHFGHSWDSAGTSNTRRLTEIIHTRAGASVNNLATYRADQLAGLTNSALEANTGIIGVQPGDLFVANVFQQSGSTRTLTQARFSIKAEEITKVPVEQQKGFNAATVRLGGNQSINDITWTALGFNTTIRDTDDMHDTVTNNSRITPPSWAKRCVLRGGANFAANVTGIRGMRITKNGGTTLVPYAINFLQAVSVAANDTRVQVFTAVMDITAADYFELEVFQSSGAALNVLSGAADSWFELEVTG